MAFFGFKRLGLVILFSPLSSRDITDLREIIAPESKLNIPGCLPQQCVGIGTCWCCVFVKGDNNCVKEKDVCISLCPKKPPQMV
ncbi:hypothetical protein MKW94_027758 [Papaver nudicaule]|uniref:Uncharacterized protein n=1 Tax=Papaver nudicaule TaxID=74823 RepID=A0AA41S3F8_PAPNU|nr:hypothetical protein [Papaver nudicaule]